MNPSDEAPADSADSVSGGLGAGGRAVSSAATMLLALVDGYAARRGFNGTVPIARNEKVVLRSSYGIGNVATGRQNDPRLRHRIRLALNPALPSARAALAHLQGAKP